ncbi:hypothetical protein KDD30_17460 (plasmid) [Photobacterium sp. GJ3]|uniref:hypothetical protein n=1 Tax=Photobacterium sp. GJ3 TaxID=2829502 RepID=UPI001B8B86F4|nr:hypothetical protein [Photobacterium sp. GJ3]QUJ69948.1 hypothetical protein KDD30_17460 [Photobacterium sp. GJ3]
MAEVNRNHCGSIWGAEGSWRSTIPRQSEGLATSEKVTALRYGDLSAGKACLLFLISSFFQDFFDALIRDSFRHKILLVKDNFSKNRLYFQWVDAPLLEGFPLMQIQPTLIHYTDSKDEKRDLAQPMMNWYSIG